MARSLRRRAVRFEVLSLLVASIAVPSLAVGRARFSWGASPDTTNARNRWLGVVVVAALLTAAAARPTGAQDANPRYTNLQVLPSDISDAELGQIMLDNLSGLGLQRRAGEGCLYCHAGSLDVPRNEWDYASDEKPAKEKARCADWKEHAEGALVSRRDRQCGLGVAPSCGSDDGGDVAWPTGRRFLLCESVRRGAHRHWHCVTTRTAR